MQTAVATGLVAGLVIVLLVLRCRSGLAQRLGRPRRGDGAIAAIRLIRRDQPPGLALSAMITVVNSGARPALVALAERRRFLPSVLRPVLRSRRSTRARRTIPDGIELLGAIDGWEARSWVAPVSTTTSRRIRIVVLIYETDHRVSRFTATHTMPREHSRAATRRAPIAR